MSCTSFIGFSGTCTSTSSHSVNVSGTLSSSSMKFTITGFKTPKTAPTDYTILSSYDALGYQIDQSNSDILFSIECTMPCRTCTSTNTVCQTCYTDTTITLFNYFYSAGDSCVETCPPSTYENSTSYRCLDCNSICQECTGVSSNCTSCDSNSSYPYLNKTGSDGTCLSGCPLYYYPDTNQFPVLCVSCISPCKACTDETSCTSCVSGFYFYINDCESSCPAGITIPNGVTN